MIFSKSVVSFWVVPKGDTEVPVQSFREIESLGFFSTLLCCFNNKPPLMKGHSALGRAVFPAFILLFSKLPSSISCTSSNLPPHRNKTTTNQTWRDREGLSPFVKPLERVSLKGDSKAYGGFLCVSFSGSVGRSLWRDWSANLCTEAIHGSPLTRRPCQLLVIPLNSEVLKRTQTVQIGLVAFFNLFFFPLDISSSSGLCVPCRSPPRLPSVSPLLPTATPAVGTGVEGVGWVTSVSTKERFTGLATQRNSLLCKSDSSPPQPFPTLPFVRVLFLLVSEVPGTETLLPHL